jgi:hypothetical protein
MKKMILPVALLGALALSACERTVVTPPNAAIVTPPAVVNNNPVPGPSGPPGPQGPTGDAGAPGNSGDTVVNVVPSNTSPAPSSDSPKN